MEWRLLELMILQPVADFILILQLLLVSSWNQTSMRVARCVYLHKDIVYSYI